VGRFSICGPCADQQNRLFNFPSSLADNTVASLLEDNNFTKDFIDLNRLWLSENYQHVTRFLKRHGIPFRQSNAALFVWVNLGFKADNGLSNEKDIIDGLRREKVYITSGTTYASEEPGWFRMVIAHPQHVLDEGLKRILCAIS
jgi:bifunctional pyridoxal-dependent enzyme with beta-cystathionase and maltose regulon repressor activities